MDQYRILFDAMVVVEPEPDFLFKSESTYCDQQQSSPRVRKASAEPVIKPTNLAECETFEGNNYFDLL